MADITFYEKPGCLNGEKQKAILNRVGHRLHCVNILKHAWTRAELEPFLASREPRKIMNYTAPANKNGEIDPETLSFEAAVALMVATPLLIRRPLIEVDGLLLQGFDHPRLRAYLGDWDGADDVLTCPNLKTLSCDEQAKK